MSITIASRNRHPSTDAFLNRLDRHPLCSHRNSIAASTSACVPLSSTAMIPISVLKCSPMADVENDAGKFLAQLPHDRLLDLRGSGR